MQQEVLGLKASQKIHIVELILENLDKPDLEIQKKWIEESEKRYDAYKLGKVKTFSYEDVMKRLEK
ncbi:addiction module protein [candidate division KSB1 bacterium]|nr:addiction module protein [candidate division KSB1 bacterium]MBL7094409.1 addiction module protein [candidate division KSB1 bacterium]